MGKCGICGKEGVVADDMYEPVADRDGKLTFEHGLVMCATCAEDYGLRDGTDLTEYPECPHCGREIVTREFFADREYTCQCCGAEFFTRAVTIVRYHSTRKD